MTAIFIASCLIGALVIEARSRWQMRSDMDRRVAALNLPNDTIRAQRCAEQSKSDNRKMNIHLVSPSARI